MPDIVRKCTSGTFMFKVIIYKLNLLGQGKLSRGYILFQKFMKSTLHISFKLRGKYLQIWHVHKVILFLQSNNEVFIKKHP